VDGEREKAEWVAARGFAGETEGDGQVEAADAACGAE